MIAHQSVGIRLPSVERSATEGEDFSGSSFVVCPLKEDRQRHQRLMTLDIRHLTAQWSGQAVPILSRERVMCKYPS